MTKRRGCIGAGPVAALAMLGLMIAAGCSSSSSPGAPGSGGAGGTNAGSGGAAGQAGAGGRGAGGAAGESAGIAAGGSAGTAAGGSAGGSAGGPVGGSAGSAGGAGGTATGGLGGTSTGGAGGTNTGGGGATGSGGAPLPACGPGTFGGGESIVPIASVTAALVDDGGAPVAGQPALACGVNICTTPFMTDVTGKVTFGTQLALKKPALRLGDGLSFTQLAIPLTMLTTDFTAGGKMLTLGKLSNKLAAPLTAGTTAVSSGVALTLIAGTQITIDTLTYDTADAQKFRSAAIPVDGLSQWLGGVQLGGAPAGFALFYGVAPLRTTFCPPAGVSLALSHTTASPNDLGWAPGTAVEFWITTADVSQSYAPYAGWRKMSDGVVSSDGATITTLPGQGFSTLENFAVRKAP